jgi:hypothetical protein
VPAAPGWILVAAMSSCVEGVREKGGDTVGLTEEVESGGDRLRKCSEDGGGAVTGTGREAEGEEVGVLVRPVGKSKGMGGGTVAVFKSSTRRWGTSRWGVATR